jgi:hypothetical protein
MSSTLYKEVKLFKGLKNDEDPKQISHEYFSDVRNFNFSDIGILGINKILAPKIIKIFLSPNLTLNTGDTMTTDDNYNVSLHTGDYLWDDPDSKWDLMTWG